MRRAGVDYADVSIVEVENAQLVAVIGEGHDAVGRRADQVGNAPDIATGNELRFARGVGAADADLFVSVDVGDVDEMLSVGEPLG